MGYSCWNNYWNMALKRDKKIHPLLKSMGYKPRKGIVVQCRMCSKEKYIRPSEIKFKNHYCSRSCTHKGLYTNEPLECIECGKEYRRSKSMVRLRGSKFCSVKCRGEWMSENQKGKNNPMWKGGVSSENKRLRAGKKWKIWRKSVFERDNYTCVFCKNRSSKNKRIELHPDHIKPFAYFPNERFQLENGRTLCVPCHKKTDTYGSKARKKYGN